VLAAYSHTPAGELLITATMPSERRFSTNATGRSAVPSISRSCSWRCFAATRPAPSCTAPTAARAPGRPDGWATSPTPLDRWPIDTTRGSCSAETLATCTGTCTAHSAATCATSRPAHTTQGADGPPIQSRWTGGPSTPQGDFGCGGAGNRTRVLRRFTRASPCAVRCASTRIHRSCRRAGVTIPVAVCCPCHPATGWSGKSP
jgi:hypothetical protein